MRIYIDTSALVKRVLDEPEQRAVLSSLEAAVDGGDVLLASSLSWVEVTRTLRSRLDYEPPNVVVDLIEVALSAVVECPITEQVIGLAARYGPHTLRSLDAIHLATAALYTADCVWAYDRVLLRAAAELGYRTISPGVDTLRR